jgi:fatty acid synthase
MVTKGTGTFEVIEGGAAVVTGRVHVPVDVAKETQQFQFPSTEQPQNTTFRPLLNSNDVYKELRLRGYNYSGLFKAVTELNVEGKTMSIFGNKHIV